MVKKYRDEKPAKIIYGEKFQKTLLKRFKSYILNKYSKSKCVNQIIACGGLIKGGFGIYSEFHHDRYGSDADLIIILDPRYKIPNNWKPSKIWKADFFDLYVLDILDKMVEPTKFFDFKPIHLIHAKVFDPNRHDIKKMKDWGAIKADEYESWYIKKNKYEKVEVL